ncbi:hypothetical protein BCR41DRAFT_361270 [Lobosporangium transversale]|uniref:Uncharacterized protein n=1 Tax=Lobosporangium transversale TaxID=64571 RepID=A0A1Y2GCN3_9FUNG|nr:hypothetical protein BCR41DRAFT_361270 [Lobosporangium transversale]ORZ06124.1 hypothetical protein BCR41DRAFT_361270 [Lobosporangium transversale]|eukprot:XP_021877393.1 hypothetical protein BCR41DRAFT_361270 [Lobosporangium transversale]
MNLSIMLCCQLEKVYVPFFLTLKFPYHRSHSFHTVFHRLHPQHSNHTQSFHHSL